MLSEEPERFLPRVVGRRLVEGGRVLVVEERVVDVRVDVDLGLLAGLLDGGVNGAGVVGLHELVLLGEEAEYGPAELAVIGLHVGMDAVEVDDRADLRIHGAGEERELAAHAEADGAHLLARGLRGQIIDGAPQILLGLSDVERMKSLPAPSGSLAVLPWYMSGASAVKPSAAKRSQTFLMCCTSPHHSWITSTPEPLPDVGVAR